MYNDQIVFIRKDKDGIIFKMKIPHSKILKGGSCGKDLIKFSTYSWKKKCSLEILENFLNLIKRMLVYLMVNQ
jgi:hypothetical protein